MKKRKALVTGAGGFIGYHLTNFLKKKGYFVRGVDIKRPEFGKSSADEFLLLDLRNYKNCLKTSKGVSEVYSLASDMGGMGFIAFNNSKILHNNLLISVNSVEAAKENKVERYFFSSSACVYPESKQTKAKVVPLKEKDAFPAQPQDAYGWEKLMTEILLGYYEEDHGMKMRIARFHNIFGPMGKWNGERAKAPAALCRKVAVAKLTENPKIEIWGDGKQTRSFCYIDDCVRGIYSLMRSSHSMPLNMGQDRLVSINQLADIIAENAGVKIKKTHIKGPQGVRGRNSNNNKVKKVLGWEPKVSLEEGLKETYTWIEEQVKKETPKRK